MALECFFYQVDKNENNPLLAQAEQWDICPFDICLREDPDVAYFVRAWWMMYFFKDRCERCAEEHGIELDYEYYYGMWFDQCLFKISLKDAEDLLDEMKNLPEDVMKEWADFEYENRDQPITEVKNLIKTMKENPDYDYYFVAWW